jgi:hypothetical protein
MAADGNTKRKTNNLYTRIFTAMPATVCRHCGVHIVPRIDSLLRIQYMESTTALAPREVAKEFTVRRMVSTPHLAVKGGDVTLNAYSLTTGDFGGLLRGPCGGVVLCYRLFFIRTIPYRCFCTKAFRVSRAAANIQVHILNLFAEGCRSPLPRASRHVLVCAHFSPRHAQT